MNELSNFEPDWVSPPGSTISALVERKAFSSAHAAGLLGLSFDRFNALLEGDISIDEELAVQLSKFLGSTKNFWLNRDREYQAQSLRAASKLQVEIKFPLSDIKNFGWLSEFSNAGSDALALAKFLGVRTVSDFEEKFGELEEALAFRRSETFDTEIGAVSAWYRAIELRMAEVDSVQWCPDRFRAVLPNIRDLTRVRDPKEFLPLLKEMCALAGVVFCLVRVPAGCPVSGIARLKDGRGLIALSSRYLADDHFWFSFFHEAGHLVLHANEISLETQGDKMDVRESEANQFAQNELIPVDKRTELMNLEASKFSIVRFARSLGIAPGIVVGQLQKAKKIRYNQFNYLKNRYAWGAVTLEMA